MLQIEIADVYIVCLCKNFCDANVRFELHVKVCFIRN